MPDQTIKPTARNIKESFPIAEDQKCKEGKNTIVLTKKFENLLLLKESK